MRESTARRCALSAALGTLAVALFAPSSPAAAVDYEAYLAPAIVCPDADTTTLSDADEGSVMLCMIDYARAVQGAAKLARPSSLATSSAIKADDIVRCGDVSHTACGRSADA